MESIKLDNNSTSVGNESLSLGIKYSLVSQVPQWSRDIFSVFMIVVFTVGLPGNILVILVQSKIARKNATDWFVTYLAFCDLLSILVCVPVFLLASRGLWEDVGNTFWCKFHFFILYFCFIGSILVIDCLCIERYHKTTGHGIGKLFFTPNIALATGGVSLFVAALVGTSAFVTTKNNSVNQCIYDPKRHFVQVYIHGIILIFVVFSCALIGYLYTKIIILFRRSSRIIPVIQMPTKNQNEILRLNGLRRMTLKTTKIIGLVTFVFVVTSCLPVLAVLPLSSPEFTSKVYGRVLLFFLTRIYMFNNFMNPVFYLWLYPAFRKKSWTLYLELCCWFGKK